MSIVFISSKGEIVLPAALRRKLAWSAGSRLEVFEEPDGLKLRMVKPAPASDVVELAGMAKAASKGQRRSLQDFDAAAVAARLPLTRKP